MTDEKLRRTARVVALGAALVAAVAVSARAADPETLRAATVKITVTHGGASSASIGSGIVLCQRPGRVDVLTAKHVVTGVGLVDDSGRPIGEAFTDVRSYRIDFYRNNPLPLRLSPQEVVLQKAEFKDLALLILPGVDADLTTARLGSSEELGSGAAVESVGHLDVDWDWTRGEVQTVGELIRHSSNIDHGYSGGPLYNAAGEVVGINLQKYRGVGRAMRIEEAMLPVGRWVERRCLGPSPPPPQPPPPVRPEPGARTTERIAGVELAWRYMPPGKFMMGSPPEEVGREADETLHEVSLTRAFLMAETETTQGQWQALMGTNPSLFKDCGSECPVENVNWYEAVAFANELSRRSSLDPCYVVSGDNGKKAGEGLEYQQVDFQGLDCEGYRLPTEAEWEYAARATTTTPFWTGKNLTTNQANYDGYYPYANNPKGQYRETTVEVRTFAHNRWGLYEVHGNVWEWTQDAADLTAKSQVLTATYGRDQTDPLSEAGPLRVIRGGSWRHYARLCRAADRIADKPGVRSGNVGFRLVRTLR